MDGERISSEDRVGGRERETDESVKDQGDVGCFLFVWKGTVHHEFVPLGQIINSCTRKF